MKPQPHIYIISSNIYSKKTSVCVMNDVCGAEVCGTFSVYKACTGTVKPAHLFSGTVE
jgi:hypothetical protein